VLITGSAVRTRANDLFRELITIRLRIRLTRQTCVGSLLQRQQ
jgi:hypothetical protein